MANNMFEWLELELSLIKTPRFHLIEGPADLKLAELVTQSSLPVPSSYKQFILKFGNAKLYRTARTSYRIGIFAGPREATLHDGTHIYHLGFHEGASVYVKPESSPGDFPIFEFEDKSEERVAKSFEEWLAASCTLARNKYTKGKWAEILRGPNLFTPEEEEIIETRRRIRWQVLGIDADGNHIFEVTNAGSRSLPLITIGLRSKDRRLNGAVRLNIRHVGPDQTAVLHAACYKNLVPPEDIEVFALPDPQPEDRDYYYEFFPADK